MRRRRGTEGPRRARTPWRAAAISVAILAAISVLAAVFLTRELAVARVRRDIGLIQAQSQQETVRQAALRQELASAGDSEAIEDRARERLGLIMPGEEKVVFVEE